LCSASIIDKVLSLGQAAYQCDLISLHHPVPALSFEYTWSGMKNI